MNIKLLGQGYESTSENSVGNHLIKFLADQEFHTFTGFSAFASQAGINGLAKYITEAKKHLKNITIITGIDQKGTSKEALEALLNLEINSFIFYQPSFSIFHPKIYLFEGKSKSELIIGSSNLTAQGLFANIETSLLVSVNLDKSDYKIIEQLKEYFRGVFDKSDPNLKKLSKSIISQLVKAKVVPTEAERIAVQDKAEKESRKETDNILSKIFPKREIAKIPIAFRTTKKPFIGIEKSQKTEILTYEPKLLWESGPLTQRDLNIPKGNNTNPTGSMLFKKGKLKEIDQRHYYRDEVFSSLKWVHDKNSTTAHLERAKALFRIIINGQDNGVFELTLTHNTNMNSRSYQQKNSMTQISWGEAKNIVAKEELIGKNARLYKSIESKNEFILAIS